MRIEFQVLSAAAFMPSSCWGTYKRVALVQVDLDELRFGDSEPRMISERARGVMTIIETWEKLNVGSTKRCAYEVALAEAEALRADWEEKLSRQRQAARKAAHAARIKDHGVEVAAFQGIG